MITQGGGGFGNPVDRDRALIVSDLENQIVTIEGVKRDYDISIDE